MKRALLCLLCLGLALGLLFPAGAEKAGTGQYSAQVKGTRTGEVLRISGFFEEGRLSRLVVVLKGSGQIDALKNLAIQAFEAHPEDLAGDAPASDGRGFQLALLTIYAQAGIARADWRPPAPAKVFLHDVDAHIEVTLGGNTTMDAWISLDGMELRSMVMVLPEGPAGADKALEDLAVLVMNRNQEALLQGLAPEDLVQYTMDPEALRSSYHSARSFQLALREMMNEGARVMEARAQEPAISQAFPAEEDIWDFLGQAWGDSPDAVRGWYHGPLSEKAGGEFGSDLVLVSDRETFWDGVDFAFFFKDGGLFYSRVRLAQAQAGLLEKPEDLVLAYESFKESIARIYGPSVDDRETWADPRARADNAAGKGEALAKGLYTAETWFLSDTTLAILRLGLAEGKPLISADFNNVSVP